MIFTDDYTPFHNEADYCEEKNETQDKQIEELSNKLKKKSSKNKFNDLVLSSSSGVAKLIKYPA